MKGGSRDECGCSVCLCVVLCVLCKSGMLCVIIMCVCVLLSCVFVCYYHVCLCVIMCVCVFAAQKLHILHKGCRSLSGEQLESLGLTELGSAVSEVRGGCGLTIIWEGGTISW